MANLIVSYAKVGPSERGTFRLQRAGYVRTEQIAIGVTSAAGSLVALAGDILEVTALDDCWVAVGPAPTAAAGGSTSRYLAEGTVREYVVDPGDKVAVIQA